MGGSEDGGRDKTHHPRRGVDIRVILNDDNLLAGLQGAIEQRNSNSGIVLQVCPPADSATGAQATDGDDETGGDARTVPTVPLLLSDHNRLPDGSFEEQETGLVVRVNPFNLVRAPHEGTCH